VSLGFRAPRMENGIVKIPILFDDYEMFRKACPSRNGGCAPSSSSTPTRSSRSASTTVRRALAAALRRVPRRRPRPRPAADARRSRRGRGAGARAVGLTMARIVTVYEDGRRAFVPTDMSYVRWVKISAALAALGHEVDIATREPGLSARSTAGARSGWPRASAVAARAGALRALRRGEDALPPGLRDPRASWGSRSSVHHLEARLGGGPRGPAGCISTASAAAGSSPCRSASRRAAAWSRCSPSPRASVGSARRRGNTIALVPGAVDAEIPAPGATRSAMPTPALSLRGNIYDPASQPEAHATLVGKLNASAGCSARVASAVLHGPGERRGIDAAHVTTSVRCPTIGRGAICSTRTSAWCWRSAAAERERVDQDLPLSAGRSAHRLRGRLSQPGSRPRGPARPRPSPTAICRPGRRGRGDAAVGLVGRVPSNSSWLATPGATVPSSTTRSIRAAACDP